MKGTKMNRYFVVGEVHQDIYANSPEEAIKEFVRLKGASEESVMVFDDNGVEILNGMELL